MTVDGAKRSALSTNLVTTAQRHHRIVFVPILALLLVLTLILQRDAVGIAVLAALTLGALADPMLGEIPPYAHGLPGVPDGPPRGSRIPPIVFLVVTAGICLAATVLVVLDAPAAAWLALALVALVGWIVGADSALRFAWHSRRLRRGLMAYAPTIAMGYAGRSGGPWQLRMWEPYLVRSGERCVVISRHPQYATRILAEAGLSSPFVQLGSRGMRDLDSILVPSLRAMFYVQNAKANKGFMKHTRLTHVWLNHGDSDKPANFNPRHALYDVLVVCGQAGIDRYERHGIEVEPDKFVVVGRPQASGVLPAEGPIADRAPKTVLYAPTWQGVDDSVNFSSLEKGPDIVRGLIARGVTVIFRPHPLSYRWSRRRAAIQAVRDVLKQDRAASDRQHLWGKQVDKTWSIVDCANRADALISDVSSVVSDFLQSEKPYAMTSMRAGVEEFRAEFSVAQTGYVILGDMSNLDDALDDLLERDPLAQARAERKRYVLGDFTGEESTEAFAELVRRLARGD